PQPAAQGRGQAVQQHAARGPGGMKPLHLRAFTATSCLGRGLAATRATLHAGRGGLTPCAFETVTLETYVVEVPGLAEAPLPARLAAYECRKNRLAPLRLAQDGFEAPPRACRAR